MTILQFPAGPPPLRDAPRAPWPPPAASAITNAPPPPTHLPLTPPSQPQHQQ